MRQARWKGMKLSLSHTPFKDSSGESHRTERTDSMTTRYTNADWAAIIEQTERELVISQEPYPCPDIGSAAFMKTIDHTLLKLEAKPVQFDELCSEARVNEFAVRLLVLKT